MKYYQKKIKIFFLIIAILEIGLFFNILITPALAITKPQLQINIPTISLSEATCQEGEDCSMPWIAEYISGIYKYAINIVGILAAVVLMFGGVTWLTAGGNASRVTEAKAWVGASLTGLVLVLCSYMIMNIINPNLVVLKSLSISTPKPGTKTSGISDERYQKCEWSMSYTCKEGFDKPGFGKSPEDRCDPAKKTTQGQGQFAGNTYTYTACCCEIQPIKDCSWEYACQPPKTDSVADNCGSIEHESDKGKCCCPSVSSNSFACQNYKTINNTIDYSLINNKKVVPASCNDTSKYVFTGYSVPAKTLKALAATESSCTSDAISPVGACGLMQLMPKTAGKTCDWLISHPQESIQIAANYINNNSGVTGGDLTYIFAGYNSGYSTGIDPITGKKGGLATSDDCDNVKAFECCINPGELTETQDHVMKSMQFYNSL